MAAITASESGPACSTGPTESRAAGIAPLLDVDPDRASVLAHGEAPQGRRRGVHASSRGHVVLPAVDPAGEHAPVELSFAERGALVRAAVLVGLDHAAD